MTLSNSSAVFEQTENLYLTHHSWLVAWLHRRLGCNETSLDLTQETFIRLLNKSELVIVQEPRAYLSTIAHGLAFNQHRSLTESALNASSNSWVDGRLSAQRMPLTKFLDELAHHRKGWIHYDSSIADLNVTGSFPLKDTDMILKALSNTLLITITRRSDYWIQISHRAINQQ